MPKLIITEIDTGKLIHSSWYASTFDSWPQVGEVVAAWFGVSLDDLELGEDEHLGDVIEIAGKPVATMDWEYRRVELRRPFLQAAE